MSKTILILIFPLFFISFQTFEAPSKIEWLTETTHDFGEVKKGEPVEFDFVFKNVSETPLTVDNVRVSCGCTAPEWDETEVILPDSTGFVKLVFTSKTGGYFYKPTKVYFSNQRKPEKLFIEGDVVP